MHFHDLPMHECMPELVWPINHMRMAGCVVCFFCSSTRERERESGRERERERERESLQLL